MPAVVAILGHSRSGKTSLLERLVADLKQRGYRVAVIKHTHKDVQIDQPGKDSWRFAKAGGDAVVVSGKGTLALIRRTDDDASLETLLHLLGGGYDIVLIEGLHRAAVPKVEVHRAGVARELRCAPEELLAVVTDEPLPVPCAQFSPQESKQLADLLVTELLGGSETGADAALAQTTVAKPAHTEATLTVNGSSIPLGPFTQRILTSTIAGLISTLDGVDEIRSFEVSVQSKPDRPEASS